MITETQAHALIVEQIKRAALGHNPHDLPDFVKRYIGITLMLHLPAQWRGTRPATKLPSGDEVAANIEGILFRAAAIARGEDDAWRDLKLEVFDVCEPWIRNILVPDISGIERSGSG